MLIFAVLLTIVLLSIGQAKMIPCESVQNIIWVGTVSGPRKTCSFEFKTATDSTGFLVSTSRTDSEVQGLSFQDNKKIKFLPENVAAIFPNLIAFNGYNCSIKSISRSNFKDLSQLLMLNLRYNQITKISRGTFEDLSSLYNLDLSDNKIKFVNGATFAELKNVQYIWLVDNVCINEDFGTQRISQMNPIVTSKCGFCEAANPIDYTTCEISKQLQTFKSSSLVSSNDCKIANETISSRLEKLSEENLSHVITIATLKIELAAAELSKDQVEKQIIIRKSEFETLTTKISTLETELKASQDEGELARKELFKARSNSESNLNSLKEIFDKLEAKLEQRFNTTKDE